MRAFFFLYRYCENEMYEKILLLRRARVRIFYARCVRDTHVSRSSRDSGQVEKVYLLLLFFVFFSPPVYVPAAFSTAPSLRARCRRTGMIALTRFTALYTTTTVTVARGTLQRQEIARGDAPSCTATAAAPKRAFPTRARTITAQSRAISAEQVNSCDLTTSLSRQRRRKGRAEHRYIAALGAAIFRAPRPPGDFEHFQTQ